MAASPERPTQTAFEFAQVKSLGMAGSPNFTADTVLTSTQTEGDESNITISGSIDITANSTSIRGKNTKFNTELKVGDNIVFETDAGTQNNDLLVR